jgi:hypothetical protein
MSFLKKRILPFIFSFLIFMIPVEQKVYADMGTVAASSSLIAGAAATVASIPFLPEIAIVGAILIAGGVVYQNAEQISCTANVIYGQMKATGNALVKGADGLYTVSTSFVNSVCSGYSTAKLVDYNAFVPPSFGGYLMTNYNAYVGPAISPNTGIYVFASFVVNGVTYSKASPLLSTYILYGWVNPDYPLNSTCYYYRQVAGGTLYGMAYTTFKSSTGGTVDLLGNASDPKVATVSKSEIYNTPNGFVAPTSFPTKVSMSDSVKPSDLLNTTNYSSLVSLPVDSSITASITAATAAALLATTAATGATNAATNATVAASICPDSLIKASANAAALSATNAANAATAAATAATNAAATATSNPTTGNRDSANAAATAATNAAAAANSAATGATNASTAATNATTAAASVGNLDIATVKTMPAVITDTLNLPKFQHTLDLIKNMDTSRGTPPKVTFNLAGMFSAMLSRFGNPPNPFTASEYTLIDFSMLQDYKFGGMALIDYFRGLISMGFIIQTFFYCWRKITPSEVIK